ncbi:MAG: hypothetical protein AAF998_22380 [Bacteroidota bacterium]
MVEALLHFTPPKGGLAVKNREFYRLPAIEINDDLETQAEPAPIPKPGGKSHPGFDAETTL